MKSTQTFPEILNICTKTCMWELCFDLIFFGDPAWNSLMKRPMTEMKNCKTGDHQRIIWHYLFFIIGTMNWCVGTYNTANYKPINMCITGSLRRPTKIEDESVAWNQRLVFLFMWKQAGKHPKCLPSWVSVRMFAPFHDDVGLASAEADQSFSNANRWATISDVTINISEKLYLVTRCAARCGWL